MEDPHHTLLSVGDVFHGRYEVLRGLKVGGMAIVYEVVHRLTRRPAALKVMRPEILAERGMRQRFELEARITAGIESEQLVEVLDAGIDEATRSAFLVLELLRGDDLESVLQRRGPLPAPEVVALLSQAASALDRVHAAGIVHRDLKPSNLFLLESGGAPPRIKVLDFGIAKLVVDSGLTTRNFGTPLYMSPEQVRGDGDIDAAADIYSLGQIAFTLLVGTAYWDDERSAGGRALFDAIEAGTGEPASTRAERRGARLPEAVDAWFARATAVLPDDRFETATALVQELASALGVSPAPAAQPAPRVVRRERRPSALAVALPIVVVGLGAGVLGAALLTGGHAPGGAQDAMGTATAATETVSVTAMTTVAAAMTAAATNETAEEAPPQPRAPLSRVIALRSATAALKPGASGVPSAPPPPAATAVPAASSPFGNGAF